VRGSGNEEDGEEGGEGEDKGGRKSEMTVLGLVFEDGKVDLCLEVEKMEGLWVGRQVSFSSSVYYSSRRIVFKSDDSTSWLS